MISRRNRRSQGRVAPRAPARLQGGPLLRLPGLRGPFIRCRVMARGTLGPTMLVPAERAPHHPAPPLPSDLLLAELGPVVMADDPCEAAFATATPSGPRKYYRARYYDPNGGRFLSEDPLGFDGGDVNLYRYVVDNPVLFVDPDGEDYEIKDYSGNGAAQVQRKIRKIARTRWGRRLLACLEKPGRNVTIRPPFWPWEPPAGSRGDTIIFDLGFHPNIYTTKGILPASGVRILAHEMGHACGCSDENSNFKVNENNVMQELGEPLRMFYEKPE